MKFLKHSSWVMETHPKSNTCLVHKSIPVDIFLTIALCIRWAYVFYNLCGRIYSYGRCYKYSFPWPFRNCCGFPISFFMQYIYGIDAILKLNFIFMYMNYILIIYYFVCLIKFIYDYYVHRIIIYLWVIYIYYLYYLNYMHIISGIY